MSATPDNVAARRDAAVKKADNVYTTYLISPWTKRLLPLLSRRVTPNVVTGLSVALAFVAAWMFSNGETAWTIGGAITYQLSFAADCIDGQLARYDRSFTRMGALLDWQFDRVKEVAVVAGLAVGADGEWGLAALVLGVLAIRSATTVGFSAMGAHAPSHPEETGAPAQLRSVALLPYGDRHLVLGVAAIAFGPGRALQVLAWWGFSAAALQIVRRLGVSRRDRNGSARPDLRGDGVLARLIEAGVKFPVDAAFALLVASVPAWLPGSAEGARPVHGLLLLGLVLLPSARPVWTGPLSTTMFELSTLYMLWNIGEASDRLVFAAVAATVLLRHFVNSSALTDGGDAGWRWDPLGWELRSFGWALAALVAPGIAVALVIYTVGIAVARMAATLFERRRLDRQSPLGAPPQ